MPVEFRIPELGENVEKGDVIRVLVSPGDEVAVDQTVLELETDKATIEVPSSVTGKVTEVRVKPGDKVTVGQLIFLTDGAGGDAKSAAKPADAKSQDAKTADAKPAETAPTKEAAGPAKAAAPSADVATAAASGENSEDARDDGAAGRSESAADSSKVVDISAGRAPAAPSESRPAAATAAAANAAPVAAAPSVRRFARELGVDIATVAGSGPGGRIGQEDVKAHVKGALTNGPSRTPAATLPDFSKWGAIDVKPMSNIRRKTAEHLSAAWQAPHVTQHDRADITALEAFRATYGERVEQAGGKLTVTAIVIKVIASALDRFPQFASSVDMANQSIVYKQYRHIGVAVDTPNGLLVPVIRDVNRKTITQIAAELGTLSQKARDKKLGLDEMSGGVFTITNLGGIGGTSFTPIINQPEVAILGLSRGGMEPVWQEAPSTALGAGPSTALGAGQFVPRQMLPLSLSYDHRAIDGADAARFLRFVAEALEQPLSMIL